MSKKLSRVLIANRGEIAVRVIRACRELGLETVAVYSDVDRQALHTRMATCAYPIGPAAASESYLRADRLLEVARQSGADAVHPGYGFLSESADFARAVIGAGLTWIGPPPAAIDAMGSKTRSRQIMQAAGVPVVPGTVAPIAEEAELTRVAAEIGYPVMLKAAAGGGGKGMRRVDDATELVRAFRAARSEAAKAFGDDAVYLEKFVDRPRHVEIQVLADAHGAVVHLFERDCSIQRRHQKVLEETPCPVLLEETRLAMAEVAIQAAQAVSYEGAGTVEFLLSGDGSFYFLEMNTRLQVEHPITELVTGIDLGRAQLRIAAGEPLWFTQADVKPRGHAIECRIYAEDPEKGFLPAPGTIVRYHEPAGPWVRVDSGVYSGYPVPLEYDPMIAKLVVWGQTRQECIERTERALREYRITGIRTSVGFFRAVMADAAFLAGDYTTGFITPELLGSLGQRGAEDEEIAAIAAAIAQFERDHRPSPGAGAPSGSTWKRAGRWHGTQRFPR